MPIKIGHPLVKKFYLVGVVPEGKTDGFYLCGGGAHANKSVKGAASPDFKELAQKILDKGPLTADELFALMNYAHETGQAEGIQPCIGTDVDTAKKQFAEARKKGKGCASGCLVIVEFTGGVVMQTHEFDDSDTQTVKE